MPSITFGKVSARNFTHLFRPGSFSPSDGDTVMNEIRVPFKQRTRPGIRNQEMSKLSDVERQIPAPPRTYRDRKAGSVCGKLRDNYSGSPPPQDDATGLGVPGGYRTVAVKPHRNRLSREYRFSRVTDTFSGSDALSGIGYGPCLAGADAARQPAGLQGAIQPPPCTI
jgi:hypothetical protein